MNTLRIALLSTMATIAVGCSSLVVQYDCDPEADFSGLQSYAWLIRPAQPVIDPRVDNSLLEARVRKAVDLALTQKGRALDQSGKPDFLVGYFATLDREVEVSVVNNYHGYGPGPYWHDYPGGGSNVYVDHYDVGTLIVDIVDAESKKLVWRGTATDRVDLSRKPQEKQEALNEAVAALFENFPPPKE